MTATTTALNVVIDSHRRLSQRIHQIELVPRDARPLPFAPAGSHLEVRLPNGMTRHYSLLDSGSEGCYRIGVLNDPTSRGGSAFLTEQASPGTALSVSAPKDHFPLDDSLERYVLIGGGIGITPLVAMVRQLRQWEAPLELHYLVRHREDAAFLAELEALVPEAHLHLHESSRQGRTDPRTLVGHHDPDVGVYACGPDGLLTALTEATRHWPEGALRMERFRGITETVSHDRSSCLVELKRSGSRFTLAPDESLLDGLTRTGVAPDSLCCEGACGTCAVTVLEGEIDHRDVLQSDSEKAANELVYVCVSRPKSEKLVLDL
ncbi:PDR/VanB family oxidoreductase [Aidingimonas halophila]|uniref:Vanillate O-demethylase ferredoxin subunit n=1 Tax=Aidingimonas halophila TaxID=574349 RepID=A0A1H3DH24_9GAMM|nr:PDR/VanB family oxidoreductase [Aidingimonas halophila]GHC29865.1 hypothetical protein GCM10008094_22590 [Aidingimonas halophila]SDX65671.1 vanillate O-demethylase ferredoxin subunit [Aidingimonas halophila]